MKQHQKLLRGKPLLGIFLWVVAISLPFSLVLPQSQAQVKPETKPLRWSTFIDRKSLKKGEDISIKVWLDSELIDDFATVTVFFPPSQLELKEELSCQDGVKKNSSCQVDPSKNTPITFVLTGKKVGKFNNVLIEVSGEDKKTKKAITERQTIQNIEVQGEAQWWSMLGSSPLLGVLIGGLLTIITTLLTNHLQNLRAKRQRRQWVLTNLPAELKITHKALYQGRETGVELWMDKLRTEGYYTELQQFAKQKPGEEDLAERLLDIAFSLGDYERDRKETYRNVKEEYQELANNLAQIISVLTT
ncbi:MAG: hypothetical protein F6K14_25780 [Symploca sp. SIO2C1]|nr:hypothetical protein [Symploca sp. SIO2C1]